MVDEMPGDDPKPSSKSLRRGDPLPPPVETIEALQLRLDVADEKHRPTKAFHGWSDGHVTTESEYVAAIELAMHRPL